MTKCKCLNCDCNAIDPKEVMEAARAMPSEEILLQMSDFYKAISDSTRIRILSVLRGRKMCVCDISNALCMTKSAISHQLKILREMNLIDFQKRGRQVNYFLADEHVEQVFDLTLQHVLEGKK